MYFIIQLYTLIYIYANIFDITNIGTLDFVDAVSNLQEILHISNRLQWIVSTCVVTDNLSGSGSVQVPAIDCLLASRAFKQDINMLPVQIVCDHILSNLYRFHYMCPQQMYFQQCVSRYCKSGQPHHMPLPVVAAFPGILNIFPATNICKVFATNICQKSSFAPKFAPNVKRKWKVSYGRPRICHASQNTRM